MKEYKYSIVATANTGAIVALFRSEVATTLVASTDTVTINLTENLTAKVVGCFSYDFSGDSMSEDEAVVAGGQSSTPGPSNSSTISSIERLWVAATAWEYSNASLTQDTDYTTRFNVNSGTQSSLGITLVVATRIATIASDTYQHSRATGSDWAQTLAAFSDPVAGGLDIPIAMHHYQHNI